jgi:hypothetical protein
MAARFQLSELAEPEARTAEGQERIRKANTTHGLRTNEIRRVAAMIRALKAEAKRLVELS